jgi:hypothetical protein
VFIIVGGVVAVDVKRQILSLLLVAVLLLLLLKTNFVCIVFGVIVAIGDVSTGSINIAIVSICTNIYPNFSASYSESQ